MATKIDTVSSRARLKPRREPYWHRISKGCYLGFRKMTADSAGTWVARCMDEVAHKQLYNALGDFTALPDHQRFDAATKAAGAWFDHLGRGGRNEVMTVAGACNAYIAHLRSTKGDTTADHTQARFDMLVFGTKLARVELTKLTPAHFDAWRKAMREIPNQSGPKKGQRRSDSTVNRDMNSVRAALNYAYEGGLVTSNFAWRAKLAPIPKADRRRDVYLDPDQRRALIAAADPHMSAFLRALSLVPLRPGALAALTVGDFDRRLGVLKVGKDKAGADRKISLPKSTAALFADHCKNKLPGALIFTNSAGRAWMKDTWKYQFDLARKAAGGPVGASVYSIRHSTITDLMHAGVDSLTVAQLAGTSVLMIEKHYGHLTQDHARSALEALTL